MAMVAMTVIADAAGDDSPSRGGDGWHSGDGRDGGDADVRKCTHGNLQTRSQTHYDNRREAPQVADCSLVCPVLFRRWRYC